MKVIELLNKIANGEEVPKKVKYKTFYWEYSEKDRDYKDTDEDYVFSCSNYDIPEMLNNEVEIIEENKGISKDIKWYLIDFQEEEKTKIAQVNMNFKLLREKLVEIIDKVNSMEDK